MHNCKQIARYGINRMKEPVSWAGLAPCLAALGIHADDAVVQAIGLIGSGLCGLLAFLLKDGDE